MTGSYLTGLGQPVGAPDPGLPPAYQEAIRLLNQTPHARIWLQNELPGMVKWMAAWASKIASDHYVTSALTQARTDWLPKLIARGYDAEAKQVQAALDSAGANAKRMAETIVRYRKENTYKDWLRGKWEEFHIGMTSSNASTVYITSERVWNLLQPYEDEGIRSVRWPVKRTIFDSTPEWVGATAKLGPRQHTSFDMDLKWDAIKQAVERIQLAMEDYEFKEQDQPPPTRPAQPAIPHDPTPERPQGTTNGGLQSALGVAVLAGIGWWWWRRTRVQSP
jgi:hypothetical protein